MKAIKILWNIPFSERDYEGINGGIVGGRDWQASSTSFNFPSSDPNFDPTLANPMEEMLIMTNVESQSMPDMRSYVAEYYVTPTNIKNSIFTKVNEYQSQTRYKFKPLNELIEAIKQREMEANRDIRLLADFDKTQMFWGSIAPKVGVAPLTAPEIKVQTRINEVQACAVANDDNVRRLIAIAENNSIPENQQQVFDINSGWHETAEWITMIDIPFNELTQ